MNPIAIIDSCFKEKFSIPRQPGLVKKSQAKIIFNNSEMPKECFTGLEEFDHIWVLFTFHKNKSWKPTVRPPRLGGNKRMGVFATRSPFRPNSTGMSVVRLEKVEQKSGVTILHVSGHDFLHETPVLDIKPYLPYVDSIPEATGNWTQTNLEKLDLQFSNKAELILEDKPILKELLRDIFKTDPRPAYKGTEYSPEDERIYGSKLENFDIRWQIKDKTLFILDLVLLDGTA